MRSTHTNPTDANPTDANPTDANPTDANPTDANPTQANPTQAIPTQVERALRCLGVRHGHTVVAGYSTGPDSTALLALLCRLRARMGIEVVAAYFDHGLRPPPRNRRRRRPRACGLDPSAGPAARGHRVVERGARSGRPGGGRPRRSLPFPGVPCRRVLRRLDRGGAHGRRPGGDRAHAGAAGNGRRRPRRHAGPARPGHPPARDTAAR